MSKTLSLTSETFTRNGALPILGFVVLMIVLGHHIPAAGGLFFFSDGMPQADISRFSIFATGLQQWFAAWAAFQIYDLIKLQLAKDTQSIAPVTNPFDRKVLLITLLFSSIAWYGLIIAQIEFFSPAEVSAPLVASGIVTGMAGTCLLFFLGRCLDQIFPKYGFWLLLVMLGFYVNGSSMVSEFTWITDGIRTGALSPKMAGASLLLLVLAAFLGALIAGYHINNKPSEPQHLFAVLLLASVVTQFVAPLFQLGLQEAVVSGALQISNSAYTNTITSIYIATHFASLLIICIIWLGRSDPWPQTLLILFASTAILAATEINRNLGGGNFSSTDLLFWSIAAWLVYQALLTKAPFKTWAEESSPLPDDNFDDEFKRGWRN